MLNRKILFAVTYALLLVQGCKREAIELLVKEVDSGTNYDLQAAYFCNDSIGYACGGTKYEIGVLLRTTDGGNHWSQPDSVLPSTGYSIFFRSPSEGWIGGNYSWLAYTSDSARTFNTSTSNSIPNLDLAFSGDQHGLLVGGSGYSDGFIKYTDDGGVSWQETRYLNSFSAVTYSDSFTAFASGYGVIYRSIDRGQNFSPLDIRGDFFVAMDFPSAKVGYFVGYQGMILKTTDAGNTFSKVMKENTPFAKREHFEAIDFWDDNNGFVAGDAGVMYQTTNGGEDWKKIKAFTDVNLRDIHLFSATSGIVLGDNGKVFLFRI